MNCHSTVSRNIIKKISELLLVWKDENYQLGWLYRRRYKVAESSLHRAETILKPRNLISLSLRTSKAKLRDLNPVIKG